MAALEINDGERTLQIGRLRAIPQLNPSERDSIRSSRASCQRRAWRPEYFRDFESQCVSRVEATDLRAETVASVYLAFARENSPRVQAKLPCMPAPTQEHPVRAFQESWIHAFKQMLGLVEPVKSPKCSSLQKHCPIALGACRCRSRKNLLE